MAAEALRLEGITKTFPGVKANDNISLDLGKGEILALAGENGAGKSTLMKILYGMYRPDSGKIFIDGVETRIKDPMTAISLGIGMVHQHFMLAPILTALENIVLGAEGSGILSKLRLEPSRKKIEHIIAENNLEIPLDSRIEDLPVGIQQRVEIAKLLFRGAQILVLDEPTAVLTPRETVELFNSLRRLTQAGKSIIFISHKLDEVLSLADRITVIRRGRVIDTIQAKGATKNKLAELMVGRPVLFDIKLPELKSGDSVLSVSGLKVKSGTFSMLQDINLEIRQGEIYGIAGVEGNGQSELIEAITGLSENCEGRVALLGVDISNKTVKERRDSGMGHIPEDRHKWGLLLPFPLYENMAIGKMHRKTYHGTLGFLKRSFMREKARAYIAGFDVRTPSETVPANALSGGNQQKAIVARELDEAPPFILAAHPTRGVDVGAMEIIYSKLIDARSSGSAVLLISADLDEVLTLSDRVGVMYKGKLVKEFSRVDLQSSGNMSGVIGEYMMGGSSNAR